MKRLLIAALLCLNLLMPAYASALNPLDAACTTGTAAAQQSSACGNNTSLLGAHGVLRKATNIIATIAAVTAIIIMMVGGLQYAVSRGDSQKLNNARMEIIGGAIGLGIIVAAQGILLLVLSRIQ